MSTLVGDVIQQARDLMQDPPQSLGTPACATAQVASAGSTLPAATYVVIVTQWTPWGESLGSTEAAGVAIGANQGIQVTSTLLPGATKIRAYFGVGAGNENQFVESTASPFTISAPGSGGAPPATNSAYLPDTDGGYARASVLFRWLNDGLRQGSRMAGGLIDYSGFPSVINWATYKVVGEWTRMTQAWYDGYPVQFAPTSSFFKRNNVTSSILAGWAISFYGNEMGVELWPQPARTATQTTLTSPVSITDTTINLTSVGGFLLPTYGMVQIGTEICGYNGILPGSNQLVGLIRGLGGTVPATWAAATQVNEINAFFQGRRVFNTQYTPGQSALNLPIPAGWDGTLVHYLMSKFYETERDAENAKRELETFKAEVTGWNRMNRQIAGPIQVGSRDYQFVVYGGTAFGGNVIP